jgi:hypothetical protein
MSVYSLLNHDARTWWFHQQLRKQGQAAEARRRERQSIRSNVRHLRNCKKNGGYCYVKPGGGRFILEVGPVQESSGPSYTTLSGYDDDIPAAAALIGIRITNSYEGTLPRIATAREQENHDSIRSKEDHQNGTGSAQAELF